MPAQLKATDEDSTTKKSSTAQKSTSTKTSKPTSSTHLASKTKSSATRSASTGKRTKSKRSASKNKKKRGQQAIDSERAREIQQALIRQHYMEGEPSGKWDAATQAALQRYQADQGWQSKTVPDSRALIKLGLGPSKDGLLNPESAMTTPVASDAKTGDKPTSDPPSPAPNQDKPQQ